MHPSLYSSCVGTHNPWYHSPAALALFPMYSQDHQDYPSPAPSDPAHSGQQPDQHQNQSSFDQIDSSIGPSRVSRRQASLKQCLPVRRISLSTNYTRPEDASAQLQDATAPHLDSPSTGNGHVASPHVPLVQSPYPNTPSSIASSYSPFEHVRRSRTRSASHFEGRPQSPALSTNSGVTNSSHTLDNSTSAEQSNISTSRPTVREKHKKHRLRDVDRKSICVYHLTNSNARQEDIGAVFGVERSTISKILKEKDRWLNISEEDECDQSTKHRPSKFPEIEEAMLNSLQEWSDDGVGITDQLIRQRALLIAKSFNITSDKFKGSPGWVENFKHRHDIRRGEWLQANKMLPPDYTTHQSHLSSVPTTPVLMAYDQRVHTQRSESQSSNCLLKHEDQHEDQQHVHGHFLATSTPANWPEAMRNDVPHSPHLTSSSSMVDPVLQRQGGPLESGNPLSHSLQDIQHSPEIQHHQQPLHYHNHHQKHHNHQQHHHQHHNQQQHQSVVYNSYGQTLSGPGVSAPTIAEAEEAINLLITFLDTDGRGLIKEDERQKLADIKCALFRAASGIPNERSVD